MSGRPDPAADLDPVTDAFATLPDPPYWAVIFSSRRRGVHQRDDVPHGESGYAHAALRMTELATQQPGYLGIESTRDSDGFGITVSYWASEDALLAWRRDAEHSLVRETGRSDWYDRYELRVAHVTRAYGWST